MYKNVDGRGIKARRMADVGKNGVTKIKNGQEAKLDRTKNVQEATKKRAGIIES